MLPAIWSSVQVAPPSSTLFHAGLRTMKWVWLLASITCEVIGTTLLKQASEESPKRCGCRTQHRDDIASLGAISRLVLRLLVPNPRKQQ